MRTTVPYLSLLPRRRACLNDDPHRLVRNNARTLATMRQREEVVVTTVLRVRVDRRAAKRGTSAPVAPEQAERPAARSGAAEAVREE